MTPLPRYATTKYQVPSTVLSAPAGPARKPGRLRSRRRLLTGRQQPSHHRGVERESEADTTVEEEPSAEQPCHRLASPTSKPMTTLQLLATRLCHRLGVFFYRNRCTIGLACAQAIALRGAPTTARRHVSAPRRRPPPHLAADHFDGPTLTRVVRVVLLF
jgi:hypothetical protein